MMGGQKEKQQINANDVHPCIPAQYEKQANQNQSFNSQFLQPNTNINEISQPGQGGALDFENGHGGNHFNNDQNEGLLQPLIISTSQNGSQINSKYQHQILNFNQNNLQNPGNHGHYNVQAKGNGECFSNLQSQMSSTNTGETNFNNRYKRPKMQRSSSGFEQEQAPDFTKNDNGQSFKHSAQLYQQQINQQNNSNVQNWGTNQRNNSNFEKNGILSNQQNSQNPMNYYQGENGINPKNAFNQTQSYVNQIFLSNQDNNPAQIAQYKQQQYQSCQQNEYENEHSAAEAADFYHCKTDRTRNLNSNFFNPLGHNVLQNNYFQPNASKQTIMINKPQKIINKASSITNGDQIMIKSDINCLTCKQEKVQLNRQLTIVIKNDARKEDSINGIQDNIFKSQGEPDLFSLQRNHQSLQTLQISNCVNCGNYIVTKQQESQRNSRTIYDYVDFGHLNKEQQSNSHILSQAIKEHPKFSFRPDVNPLSVMSVLKKYQKIYDNQLSSNQLLIMQSLAPNNKGIAKFDYNPNSKYLKHRRKTIKALFQVSERFGFNNETIHHSIQLFDAIFMQKCESKDQNSDEAVYQDPIESLREKYESCKGVISEQICTFIASVCLFISSKYLELKYPVVEDICELMQCPFTFDEFVEMEQTICAMFEWDLQIPTCIESLQSFFAQGVIFSTDLIGGKQQIGNQVSTKLVENLSQICSASASHIEELLQKMKQICLTLLPNLLIYDAQLFMSEELVSPVHLALAIIIEGRRCLGIRPLFAEEFKWMAFGDLYKKAARYENSNYCKIGSELIEKEVQKVQVIVQKVQISLYQKNFEQEQQNKEKKEKCSLNNEINQFKEGAQIIQFHPNQNEDLLSPQQNQNLQALTINQNEEDKNQHQIPKRLLSDILNQRKQDDIQRQWSDPNQIPKKQNEIHTAKSLHSTEPTTEAEKKLQNKNNFKEQQLKLHHLESLNTIEKIEEKGSEIEESNVEHNYPDEFKEGNQTVRPTCSNNDPLSYNNQQNIIRTEVQEELRKQDIKPSFLKENQIKINLEALQKNQKLNQIKIQPLRIQFQNNQNGLATVRNIIVNKSAYESQKEGVKSKIQDILDPKDQQLIIKKDQNTKSLNTLGSSNYSYQNAYSDDLINQQSFQNNVFPQDLKSLKNNTFINVSNSNENQKAIEDGQLKPQKYTQLYNTVIDPNNQNNMNYLQVHSQQKNDIQQKIQNKSQKNKSQQSISSKDASLQSRSKSNWSNPDNNDLAAPFKFSRQSQPQPMSVKPQLQKPRPSSNSINVQQQFNQIQVAIKSPKAKAKQSSSVTSVGGPVVSQKPPQCNLKIVRCKNILKTNLIPSNQPKIVLKGKKQINNRKESVGGSVSSRDSDMNNAAMNSLRQILVGPGQAIYGANLGNMHQQDRLVTEISNPGEIKQPSSYNMSTSTERASQQYFNDNNGLIKNNQKQSLANLKGVKSITHRGNEQSNVFQYQSNPKVSQQKQQVQIIGRAQGPRANGNQTIRKGLQSSHAITAEQNSSVGRSVIGPKMQNEKMTEKKSIIIKNNAAQQKTVENEQFLNTDFKKNIENQHYKNLSKHSDWTMQVNLNHHYNSVQQDITNGQKQYNSITDSKQNILESSSIGAANDKTHGLVKQNLNQIISQKIDKILDDNRSNCTAVTAPNPISSSNINFISSSLISRNTDFKQPTTARGISSNYYSLNQKQQIVNNAQQKGLPPKMQKCSTSIGIIPTTASSYSGMNQDKKDSSSNLISSQKIQLNIAKKHQATNQLQPKLPLKIDFDETEIHKQNRNSNIQTQLNKTSSKQILSQQIKSHGQQQKPPIIHKVPISSQPNANTGIQNKQDYSQIYLLTAEDNPPSRNNNLISNQSSQGKQIFQTMQSFQHSTQLYLQSQQRNHLNDNLNIQNYLQANLNGSQLNLDKFQSKDSHSKLHLNINQQMIKQDQLKKIQGAQTSRNISGQNGMSLIDSWKHKANNQKSIEHKSACDSNGNYKNGVQNSMMSQLKLLQNIQTQQNRKQSVESQNGTKSQSNIGQVPQKQVVKINGRQTKITPQFLLNR